MKQISELRDLPRPCPKCGEKQGYFLYTEPSYGDGWKCSNCGFTFSGVNNAAANYLLFSDDRQESFSLDEIKTAFWKIFHEGYKPAWEEFVKYLRSSKS